MGLMGEGIWMPNFEVRVRLLDVDENDAWSARRSAEERLRAAGFKRWQIVSLRLQDAFAPATVPNRRRRRSSESSLAGGLVLIAALAWSLWFWWTMF